MKFKPLLIFFCVCIFLFEELQVGTSHNKRENDEALGFFKERLLKENISFIKIILNVKSKSTKWLFVKH